jgi:hypothetical protein
MANLLDMVAKYNCNVVILGDINVHLDKLNNTDTKNPNKFLQSHDLEQLIHMLNHNRNHTLDVVIASSPSLLITDILVAPPSF